MLLARKLFATLLGQDPNDPTALEELRQAGVPVSEADCRTCANPCDEGHEEYPRRFDVDMETEMRGSIKPYRRQVVISTGKTDWGLEVTFEHDSLAKYVSSAESRHSGDVRKNAEYISSSPGNKPESVLAATIAVDSSKQPSGVYTYKPSGRLSILNGSHRSIADDPDTQATVIVLPDYVVVTNVPISSAGASALWEHALDPAVPLAGTAVTPGSEEMKTWTLPYNCLIMLCSHKRRDARCHIASQRLQQGLPLILIPNPSTKQHFTLYYTHPFHDDALADFSHYLELEGWNVDTDLEDLSSTGPPLESIASTEEARYEAAVEQLRTLCCEGVTPEQSNVHTGSQDQDPTRPENKSQTRTLQKEKKALILKNSHVGGHKYAGIVVIYFPRGSSVWYGRVTPHEVQSIVQHTILGGKVLPQLLRGGLGISRPGCASLLDW